MILRTNTSMHTYGSKADRHEEGGMKFVVVQEIDLGMEGMLSAAWREEEEDNDVDRLSPSRRSVLRSGLVGQQAADAVESAG